MKSSAKYFSYAFQRLEMILKMRLKIKKKLNNHIFLGTSKCLSIIQSCLISFRDILQQLKIN